MAKIKIPFRRFQTVFGEPPERPDIEEEVQEGLSAETAGIIRGLIIVTGVFIALVLALLMIQHTPTTPSLAPWPDTGEFKKISSEAQAILDNYGWVDKNVGVVRIPVKEAMSMLADKLPARALPTPTPVPEKIPLGGSSNITSTLIVTSTTETTPTH